MKTYALMGRHSDVSVIDTEELGDAGIEVNTRDGRTWSCLTIDGAIEQLSLLCDQGIRGCFSAIVALDAEKLATGAPMPVPEWASESFASL